MHVTYKPEDQPEDAVQRWEFDPGRVRQSDAEIVEKRYGQHWDAFRAGLLTGDSKARRVLLWHLLRRDHHTLRYEDTPDFLMGELIVEQGLDELLQLKERVAKAAIPDEQREQVEVALDIEISEAIARGEVESGKATSSSAD